MRKVYCLLFLACLLSAQGCDSREKLYYSPPSVIPNTQREMKTAGFWIARQPSPDKVILDQAGIASFNSKIEKELKTTTDLSRIDPVYSGVELKSYLEKREQELISQRLYSRDSKLADRPFYRNIKDNMDLESIPAQINVRYGFVRRYADQRILPTDLTLTAQPGDIDFDELQNSSFDIGTPLAVLHETKDGVWAYALSPTSSGWVKKDAIAFCGSDELKSYLERVPFLVVTSAKADIYLDRGLTKHLGYVRMGAKFPCAVSPDPEVAEIVIWSQTDEGKFTESAAFINRSDVNFGYLSFTSRNILRQAFKLLNAPYGWGGKNGEQDCSSFLEEVFSTAGIALPRNSSDQARAGISIGAFTEGMDSRSKMLILKDRAIGGATILQMKGHILLYLGIYDGKAYAIHEAHAYRQRMRWGRDIVREVNRVIVSDLSLGHGSKKGSLLERIISIRNID